MNNTCPALQDWSVDATAIFVNYRITIAIFVFLIINLLSSYLKDVRLPKYEAFSKMSDKDTEMLTVRTMQLVFGVFISVTGYTCALVDLISGCNFLLKPWAFWVGGGILTLFDFHEFGTRWPLSSHVLVHHIAVFTIALFYTEFSVLNEIQFTTVIFIANIGLCWVTDYAHVIFRTSQRLTYIIRARKAYLILSPPIRILNIFLLCGSIVFAIIAKNWLLFGVNLFMELAYIYNTYKALLFVIHFDCKKYYNTHQKIWLGRNHSLFPTTSAKLSRSLLIGKESLLSSMVTRVWVPENDFFDDAEEEESDHSDHEEDNFVVNHQQNELFADLKSSKKNDDSSSQHSA
mmetsp:Transcript_9570/g.10625  ORF Transcript_9570/g.10625 Transcript_9570/m.10625 type:complete len:346 (-) Transcript_9570:170-1207(-)|eukprot:CAMPEP_0194130654 /NCGR_PEP_ID=MMETSP0152-20130528/1649_1 /TAXON_ID=1049557 /ORGANISM="Thalassiothrix antarctica, Strain L6-D1" /LENGTH=345 /DNA_ID=CAMNT_0038825235 /DNA_START=39 /DNA_END=1076 /DNA_ORIENTATION=+